MPSLPCSQGGIKLPRLALGRHGDTLSPKGQCAFQALAKLRLLLVERAARGQGLGARLVDECLRFAHQAGSRQIALWTNSVVLATRCLYAKAGFRLVASGPHHAFGHDLVEETWLLEL